ncbi:hypothetical protein H0H92_014625, partial [Tricholoma furcatifolium]
FLYASPSTTPAPSPAPADPDFTLPILANLTHLDIYQGAEHFASWSWQGFASLSQLTYLSFDVGLGLGPDPSAGDPLEGTVRTILMHVPPSLKICLVLLSSRGSESMIVGMPVGGFGNVHHDYIGRIWAENEIVGRMARGEMDPRVVVGTNEDFFAFLDVNGDERESDERPDGGGYAIGLAGLLVVHFYDDLVRDWGFVTGAGGDLDAGSRGGEDMWEKAERIIERRQRKALRSC